MVSADAMAALPYSLIVPTVYGQMIVNRHDINQTNSLFKTGQAVDHAEIVALVQVCRGLLPASTILDVGANFGTYSLALARELGPQARIHAFEPQRIIFNMLAGSVALNALENVYCHNLAVGDHEGSIEIPQFDYGAPMNFGSVEFGLEQYERLNQKRGSDPARSERVPLTTVDRFGFDRVALIKIDVEGMENEVLTGAEQTIRRCRPALFVEHLKVVKAAIGRRIAKMNYRVYDTGMNYLCIPEEHSHKVTVTYPREHAPTG